MIQKELCKAAADRIFLEKAVLIGTEDVIAMIDVAEMFGKDALRFVMRVHESTKNYYSLGDSGIEAGYLTYKGFLMAVTCNNVRLIYARGGGKGIYSSGGGGICEMTIIILHEGRAWAMGASPEAVGEDCRKLEPDSKISFVADPETRMRYICRAWELMTTPKNPKA